MKISKRKLKKIINEITDVENNISIKKIFGICPLELINILLKSKNIKF